MPLCFSGEDFLTLISMVSYEDGEILVLGPCVCIMECFTILWLLPEVTLVRPPVALSKSVPNWWRQWKVYPLSAKDVPSMLFSPRTHSHFPHFLCANLGQIRGSASFYVLCPHLCFSGECNVYKRIKCYLHIFVPPPTLIMKRRKEQNGHAVRPPKERPSKTHKPKTSAGEKALSPCFIVVP